MPLYQARSASASMKDRKDDATPGYVYSIDAHFSAKASRGYSTRTSSKPLCAAVETYQSLAQPLCLYHGCASLYHSGDRYCDRHLF